MKALFVKLNNLAEELKKEKERSRQLADALRALLDADPSQVKRESLAGVKQAGREALAAYDAQQPGAWQPPSGDAPIRSVHFAQHDVPALSDHTAEPWRACNPSRHNGPPTIAVPDGVAMQTAYELRPLQHGTELPEGRKYIDARRIVACVNACAGIPTEALERANVREIIRNVYDKEQQS